MYNYNFHTYVKKEEESGGDYWELLDASYETIKKEDISLYSMHKIIPKITNEELKTKLIKKMFDLAMEQGIISSSLLDLFSYDELKQILEHELEKKVTKCKEKPTHIKYFIGDIIDLLSYLNKLKDSDLIYSMITPIVDILSALQSKTELIIVLQFYKKNNIGIYNRIIYNYDNYLPTEYKSYIKMSEHANYMNRKCKQYNNEDLDIGIDPRISIGPEIEANNNLGIHIDISNQRGFEEYVCTSDATVPNGDEVYPMEPFHNTKEDMIKFCVICETMKELGYFYDDVRQNAAGQINLGLDYLDSKESILNFYEIYGNCEELLYYISSEEGQLFRQSVYSSSRIKPLSEIVGKRVLDEELSREDVIKLFNNHLSDSEGKIEGLQYKKNSVCLRGYSDYDYRLEFRIPNGGCNYRTWIDNIRLYGKMLEVSKKLADAMKKDYLTPEEERLLNIKIELQDINLSKEEKLNKLMDLLFDDENIKQIYRSRFYATIKKINETDDDRYFTKNPYEPGFDEVNFESQYHSRIGQDYTGEGVIEYDPQTDIITYGK